jgi:hypothetical protein
MNIFNRLLALSPQYPLKGTLSAYRKYCYKAGSNSLYMGLGGKTLILALLIILTYTAATSW